MRTCARVLAWRNYRAGWAEEFAPPRKDPEAEAEWESSVRDSAAAAHGIVGDVVSVNRRPRVICARIVPVALVT